MSKQSIERPILVTGGAGFFGSHLVRRLLDLDYNVAVLIKNNTNTKRIVDILPRLTILHDDLADEGQLVKKLEALNPLGVFHLAGIKTKGGVGGPDDDFVQANLLGTMHLIKALNNIDYKFFIHSGTSFEYGVHDQPLTETDACDPVGVYAISKLAATLFCRAVAQNTGKPILIFRIFSLYGPSMDPGQLFYEVVSRALKNEEIILTKPEINRDFIFIEDLVDLYVESMDKADLLAGQIFNAGSGKTTTLMDLINRVLFLTGSESRIKWDEEKSSVYDRGCQEANMAKTFKTFSWRPNNELDSGILKIMQCFH